jgi:hypothetical protein
MAARHEDVRHEQEWGDYPYRGETWRGGESPADSGYRHPYGGMYGFGWETERPTFRGVGPKGYQRSDARIQEDACDRLTRAPDIDASDIEVTTTKGEVTLSGRVRDRQQKRRAEDVMDSIPGVRDVQNNLRISRLDETSPQESPRRGGQ